MAKYETETIRAIDEPLGSRPLLWATVAYAVFGVAGLVAVGTFPAATETSEQVVAWFRENGQGVRWFVWTWTVTIPPSAIMIAFLRRMLPAVYRDVFLIGAISYLVAVEIGTWSWGGLALHADHLNPATARTVLDVVIFLGPVDRINYHYDGAGYIVGTTRSGTTTPLAWGFGRGRFFGAGRRDNNHLRRDGLHSAWRGDEHATGCNAHPDVAAGFRGVGRNKAEPDVTGLSGRAIGAPFRPCDSGPRLPGRSEGYEGVTGHGTGETQLLGTLRMSRRRRGAGGCNEGSARPRI